MYNILGTTDSKEFGDETITEQLIKNDKELTDEELKERYRKLIDEKQAGVRNESTDDEIFFIGRLAMMFDIPVSPTMFFTIRGSENFHIYLWIAKDFSWTQDLYFPSLVFGVGALCWCGVLMRNALKHKNYEEVYFLIPLTIWLFANFWWMEGEIVNNDDEVHQPQSGNIMLAGISCLLLYYFVLVPCKVIVPDINSAQKYNDAGLTPRFSFFTSWRHYEHFHTLCWLAKDLSWVLDSQIPWIIFSIPTIVIALDFIWIAAYNKKLAIDTAHYIAQFMWVMGNLTWAFGELFLGNEETSPLFEFSRESINNPRWYASWILFCAYVPIVLLYILWLPLTYYGYISSPRGESFDRILAKTEIENRQQRTSSPDVNLDHTPSSVHSLVPQVDVEVENDIMASVSGSIVAL